MYDLCESYNYGLRQYAMFLGGTPLTPRQREIRDHPLISEAELIKKRDILDPLEET
jgi:hypothetical protein